MFSMYAGKYPGLDLKRKSKLNKMKGDYFTEDRIIKRHAVRSGKRGWLLWEYGEDQCWLAWCFHFFSYLTTDDDGASLHPTGHDQPARWLSL